MAHNPCTPATVFGGFNHTLFLGCSIVEFSVSMGWNEQVSELTVILVEDTCTAPEASPKHYYDLDLNKQTTTDVDPGFFGEQYDIIGIPVYFRAGEFEFSGMVQSWEKKTDSTANPSYTVKIVSPLFLLSNTELIVGNYSGPVAGFGASDGSDAIPNIFNIYGYTESFGEPCPTISQVSEGLYQAGDGGADGAVFGTHSQGYGGSFINDNGLQWTVISDAINVLANAIPAVRNDFSPYGRIIYKGLALDSLPSPWSNGYGIMQADSFYIDDRRSEYYIDISELPVPPSYFRFDGTNINLMEAISRVCQESGFDFYIELLPIKGGVIAASSGIAKLIKVRTVNRTSQPSLTAIDSFNTAAKSEGTYIQGTIGRELRNELTSSFLAGGKKQTVYQVVQNTEYDPSTSGEENLILPFFGFDSTGNVILPRIDDSGWWQFDIETEGINNTLNVIDLPSKVTITEKELMAAKAGFDSWQIFAPTYNDFGATGTDLWNASKQDFTIGGIDFAATSSHLVNEYIKAESEFAECTGAAVAHGLSVGAAQWRCLGRYPLARDLAYQLRLDSFTSLNDEIQIAKTQDKEAVFAWLSTFANEYYGQQYSVAVPNTCVRFDSESQKVIFSETPTNNGWTEVSTVIGLTNPSPDLNFFRTDNNTIGSFAAFSGAGLTGADEGAEVSHMNEDNFLIPSFDSTGTVYVKSSVNSEYVFADSVNYRGPRVVVTLSEEVPITTDDDKNTGGLHETARLAGMAPGLLQNLQDIRHQTSSKYSHVPFETRRRMPHKIAFGMQSNTLTYGPWWNRGLAGQTKIEQRDGLVPWEYGSVAAMNTAADALIDAGITNMRVGEMGSITLAGYPTLPLGAEINSASILNNKHLIENRNIKLSSFNTTLYNGNPLGISFGQFDFGFLSAGTYGPNITNMSVSVGPGGMQTTYRMRTYTPKFGTFSNLNANRLRQIGQNRMKNVRDFQTFVLQQSIRGRLKENKGTFSVKAGSELRAMGRNRADIFKSRSPHEVFIGEKKSFRGFSRDIIATSSLSELPIHLQQEYDEKSFMSLDGLLRPVTMDSIGILPGYYAYNTTANSPRGALGPLFEGSGSGATTGEASAYVGDTDRQSIVLDDLNPYTNPTGLSRSNAVANKHTGQGNTAHDIEILGRGQTPPDSGMIMPHNHSPEGVSGDVLGDYQDNYRLLAMRGPILLQQWGYDTDGKPVPNKVDIAAHATSGVFKETGLHADFLSGWLRHSETWPVAPVDLRLDRARGVWVSPPKKEKIVITLNEDINAGQAGRGSVPSGYSITGYEDDGTVITEPALLAHDILDKSHSSGDKAIVDYNETKKRWEILSSPEVQGEWAETVTEITACVKHDSGRRQPGTGTVDLIERFGGNETGGASTGENGVPSGTESGDWYETGTQVVAFNMVQSTIAAGKDVQIKRIGGYRFIDVEDCS